MAASKTNHSPGTPGEITSPDASNEPNKPNKPNETLLTPLRQEIDEIDQKIIALLARRFEVVNRVIGIKALHHIPVVLPARIQDVKEKAAKEAVRHGLDRDFIEEIFDRIITRTCDVERQMLHPEQDPANIS